MAVHTAQDTRFACKGFHQWQNRSLLYDKFPCIEPEKFNKRGIIEEKETSMRRLIDATEDKMGAEFRRQLPDRLSASGRPVKRFQATLKSRLMVDMAGTVIENAGLCLDRHFGMPYIPGSALKGLALRGARVAGTPDAEIKRVFGEQDRSLDARKGLACFLPAYPTHRAQLELDVMTGHHGGYYRGDKQYAESPDTESPIPVKFPTVKAGTEFCFVVCGRSEADQALVEQAANWLITGITELGVGAKTAAGYGWFQYDAESEKKREAAQENKRREELIAQQQADAEAQRLAEMSPEQRRKEELLKLDDGALAGMVKSLAGEDEITQRAFFRMLQDEKCNLWKDWRKAKKGKGVERVDILRQLASSIGEELP